MKRKFYFTFIFALIFTVANATDGDKTDKVDPEKDEKKKKTEKVNPSKTANFSELSPKEQVIRLREKQFSAENKENKKSAKVEEETEVGEDVQSFNFIYYIIHQFKFSDFVTD